LTRQLKIMDYPLSRIQNQFSIMAKHAEKYYHKSMDRDAGIAHKTHRTKIVATVGPACDSYDQLLQLVKATTAITGRINNFFITINF